MKLLPFKSSKPGTIGTELEIQLVNPHSGDLIAGAKALMRQIEESSFAELIKPEITQSMIEINSSPHHTVFALEKELLAIQHYLLIQGEMIGIDYAGGGTHPFQKWMMRKIYPTKRFKLLSRQYRSLSKLSTVFGLHIHYGCENPTDAIYLTHALARYIPQFIALSASSPFNEGVDTGFCSSRANIFNVYPSSGVIPYLPDWKSFSTFFYKMKRFGIIKNMKDFYWDIRPKPEFGTVEVRVCDMPLTIHKAMIITAYLQALGAYLISERPIKLQPDFYILQDYNRFQAMRYGFEGIFINASNNTKISIADDIFDTLDLIQAYSQKLNLEKYLAEVKQSVMQKKNDATLLRRLLKQTGSFAKLVEMQCTIWKKNSY
ncbi:MAG: glutamate--cysteine ligase [Gammaproteobacteria bacterium]|nr:glutamate--cysteine ligase [Gammaproteobacteria bacterium]